MRKAFYNAVSAIALALPPRITSVIITRRVSSRDTGRLRMLGTLVAVLLNY